MVFAVGVLPDATEEYSVNPGHNNKHNKYEAPDKNGVPKSLEQAHLPVSEDATLAKTVGKYLNHDRPSHFKKHLGGLISSPLSDLQTDDIGINLRHTRNTNIGLHISAILFPFHCFL